MARLVLLEERILVDEAMLRGKSTLASCQTVLGRAIVHAEIVANPGLTGAIWDAKGFVQHPFIWGVIRVKNHNMRWPFVRERCDYAAQLMTGAA